MKVEGKKKNSILDMFEDFSVFYKTSVMPLSSGSYKIYVK